MSLASLVIKVDSKDVNKAKTDLQGLSNQGSIAEKSMSNIGKVGREMGAGIAAGAAVAGAAIVGLITQVSDLSKQIEILSRLSNQTPEDFQKSAFAANKAGVDMQKYADIMKDTQDKIGDFLSTGGGELKDFFEQIAPKVGVTAEQFRGLSGKDGLQLYYNTLKDANVSQAQMTFYMESIADEATLLAPLLEDNGKKFKEFGDQAERAGVIMSDSLMGQLSELRKNMDSLKQSTLGATYQFLEGLLPALNDIGAAFNNTSNEGSKFSSVGTVIGNMLKGLVITAVAANAGFQVLGKSIAAIAAIGANLAPDLDQKPSFLIPLELYKAYAKTKGAISNIGQLYKQDITKVIKDAAATADKIAIGTPVVKSAATTNNSKGTTFTPTSKTKAGSGSGGKTIAEQQNETASKLAQDRININKEMADKIQNIEMQLVEDIAKIKAAGFNSDREQNYISVLTARANIQKKLIDTEVQYEANKMQYSAEQRILYEKEIARARIVLDKDLTAEQRAIQIAALEYKYEREKKALDLDKRDKLQAINEIYQTEFEKIRERAELKKERIGLESDPSTSIAEQAAVQIAADQQIADMRYQAWANYRQSLGYDDTLQNEYAQRQAALVAALDAELLTESEYQQRSLQNEQQYQNARIGLHFEAGAAMAANAASFFGALLGEQSTAYKAMFAIQKGFAVAQAVMAIPESYSKAFNAMVGIPVVGPVLAPIAGATAAAAQVAQAASIRGTSLGFADGGYTGAGGKYEPAGIVHKGEVVWSQADVARSGGVSAVESARKGGMAGYTGAQVSNKIINVLDPSLIPQAMASSEGESVIKNVISRNQSEIRQLLGV